MDATTKVGVGFASQRQKQGSRSVACFSLSLPLSLSLARLSLIPIKALKGGVTEPLYVIITMWTF
jgi:hypothetical protein